MEKEQEEKTSSWKPLVCKLFSNEELNVHRCLSIMAAYDISSEDITTAVIENAIRSGSKNVTQVVSSLTKFMTSVAKETLDQEAADQKVSDFVGRFNALFTMLIPRDKKTALALTGKSFPPPHRWGARSIHNSNDEIPIPRALAQSVIKPEWMKYYDAIDKYRFSKTKREEMKVSTYAKAYTKCRMCSNKYYVFVGFPGLEICIDCFNEYVACVAQESTRGEARLAYEADMKDFLDIVTSDDFAGNPITSKRKRSQ